MLVVLTTYASAGTLTEPVVEEVMKTEMAGASNSSGGILPYVSLLFLAVVVTLVASKNDASDVDNSTDIPPGVLF